MIFLGCDHGGFLVKEAIKLSLENINVENKDFGSYNSSDIIDYPKIALQVALETVRNKCFGIIVCGSGIGVSIVANKVKGVKAALCHNETYARLSRSHNDANVLCLGGRIISKEEAIKITLVFINTKFDGGRHIQRINYIKDIENST